MKKTYIVILCILYQCICVGMHSSTLKMVISGAGENITEQFGALVGNSDFNDHAGICYGTHGARAVAAKAAKEAGNELPVVLPPARPRCHSEFYLLSSLSESAIDAHIDLNHCKIVIENSQWYPCRMTYGSTFYGKTEYNPGTPCHTYLQNFATQNHCEILVNYPGGNKSYQ